MNSKYYDEHSALMSRVGGAQRRYGNLNAKLVRLEEPTIEALEKLLKMVDLPAPLSEVACLLREKQNALADWQACQNELSAFEQ